MPNTRREFLQTSLAATAAAAIPGHAATAAATQPVPAGRHQLKLGVVTYNIARDWTIDQIIKNLTAVGIEAVELRTTHAHGVEPTLSASARAEVRKKFEGSPVVLASLGTTCEYHAEDPAVVKKNIEETRRWIELARDVGAASVKVRPNGLRKDVAPEQTPTQIGEALAVCAKTAAEHDVLIQLEVHGAETSRLPAIRRILDAAGNPSHLRVCWNSNQTDLADAGLEANFRLVASQIGQVHMRDPYLEEYPWRRLVQLLQEIGFDGYCYAELGEPSCDGVRVLRYFKGMLRALQGIEGPATA